MMSANLAAISSNRSNHDFVVDGHRRACEAIEPEVRAEVLAEYGEAWKTATGIKRWWLRRKIEREIERRVEELAPRDALY